MFEVDGFCLDEEIIVTQPGTEIVSVTITKETSNHCIQYVSKNLINQKVGAGTIFL